VAAFGPIVYATKSGIAGQCSPNEKKVSLFFKFLSRKENKNGSLKFGYFQNVSRSLRNEALPVSLFSKTFEAFEESCRELHKSGSFPLGMLRDFSAWGLPESLTLIR
jgi:hypothetical protein